MKQIKNERTSKKYKERNYEGDVTRADSLENRTDNGKKRKNAKTINLASSSRLETVPCTGRDNEWLGSLSAATSDTIILCCAKCTDYTLFFESKPSRLRRSQGLLHSGVQDSKEYESHR